MFRIGQGYDVHRLVPGRELVLCGVKIPHSTGLLGHSDADVAVHALMDALIGALALGDIGGFFPDTDPAYAGADSMKLLEQVLADPRVRDWRVENLDLTIVAQKPRLLPYHLRRAGFGQGDHHRKTRLRGARGGDQRLLCGAAFALTAPEFPDSP